MNFLKETIENDFKFENLVLIIGILSDKKIKRMLEIILPLTDIIITTKPKSKRACDPNKLKDMIIKMDSDKQIVVSRNTKEALKKAKKIAEKNDLICVTGSLFTIGEARDILVQYPVSRL